MAAAAAEPGHPGGGRPNWGCREKGIPCLDVTDALVKASQESPAPLYKKRDTHWTVRGNRVAAEAEAASLAPLVCPRARVESTLGSPGR